MTQLETHAFSATPDVVLCGNKADLEEQRKIDKSEAMELADRLVQIVSQWMAVRNRSLFSLSSFMCHRLLVLLFIMDCGVQGEENLLPFT